MLGQAVRRDQETMARDTHDDIRNKDRGRTNEGDDMIKRICT